MDHVNRSDIITPEHATDKKEQMLINKKIVSQVKTVRRNLYTV